MSTVLKHLFPPAAPLGKRVLSFVNRNDKIHFRHFVWTDERHDTVKGVTILFVTVDGNVYVDVLTL